MWERIKLHVLKSWKKYFLNLFLVVMFIYGMHYWQTRDLLSASGSILAPEFLLPDLQGVMHKLEPKKSQQTLLYFFAPWCSVCHLSISNLEKMKQSSTSDALTVYAVALDYENKESVADFMRKHQLSFPVLLGEARTRNDYKISVYPTYYILDNEGYIHSHTVGYSTKLGFWWNLSF